MHTRMFTPNMHISTQRFYLLSSPMWAETQMQKSYVQYWLICRGGGSIRLRKGRGCWGMCLWWHWGMCRWAEGWYRLWFTPHNLTALLLQKPVLTTASIQNSPSWLEPMGQLLGLDGGVCYLPVSLMEPDAHLLWLGVKLAMMSSETMALFSDYTADMTQTHLEGTGACMVKVCRLFSFAPLI